MKYSLGRYVYGLAAIGFGICALASRNVSISQQLESLKGAPYLEILTYIVAIIEILGGMPFYGRERPAPVPSRWERTERP